MFWDGPGLGREGNALHTATTRCRRAGTLGAPVPPRPRELHLAHFWPQEFGVKTTQNGRQHDSKRLEMTQNDSKRHKMDTKMHQEIADFTCRVLILRAARAFRFRLGQPLAQGGDLFLQAFDALAGGDECDLPQI